MLFRPPEFDEAEVLHGSWLIARVGRIWIDVFEHHSPLFNTINATIFNADSPLFVLNAKLFALFTYLLRYGMFWAACYLWFGVAPAYRVPFLLYGSASYILLTWPCDLGVVRPENYSALAFFGGSLCAYFIGRTSAVRTYAATALSGFLLMLAVGFSPRSIVMVVAVGLAVLSERKNRENWICIGVFACAGGAAALLLNLMVAPLAGFYLWFFEFNRQSAAVSPRLPAGGGCIDCRRNHFDRNEWALAVSAFPVRAAHLPLSVRGASRRWQFHGSLCLPTTIGVASRLAE